jgi:type III secretory pathway component EscV
MKYLVILALAACGPIPVQVSKTSQEQRMSSEQAQTASTAADQQSSHQSESKQGTNSMPVIIICNSNNSPNSTCATPKEGGALNDVVDNKLRRKIQ